MKVDRTGTSCRAIPMKVEKNTRWQDQILEECVKGVMDGIPTVKVLLNSRCKLKIYFHCIFFVVSN